MAGLSGKQNIVDIAAASEQLVPSQVPPAKVGPGPGHKVRDPSRCALSHVNEPDARFCSTCGLSMNAQAPPPLARPDQDRPRPVAELTDEEKAERERQHAEAVAAAAAFEKAPEVIVPSEGEAVLIHFVEDGLTAFGRVWYRGQELAIGPDHPRWAEALGWIMLDKAAQFERWGKQYFDHGPWPFQRSYVDPGARYEEMKTVGGQGRVPGPSEEELRRADAAEAARGRGVPAPALR
jgi:hypothetical protein